MTSSPPQPPRHRIELSATQVTASVLAAVSATVAASYLGVTGTVVGAGMASAVTVVGSAVFGHGLHRTRERVAPTFRPMPATYDTPPELPGRAADADQARRLRGLGVASLALFALVLSVLTTFELITGRPISDLVRGDSGSGTTLFGADAATSKTVVQQPVRTQTVTVTQSVVVTTPTVTSTASAVTETTTPTVTETPTSSAPTTTSSSTPSASPSP